MNEHLRCVLRIAYLSRCLLSLSLSLFLSLSLSILHIHTLFLSRFIEPGQGAPMSYFRAQRSKRSIKRDTHTHTHIETDPAGW